MRGKGECETATMSEVQRGAGENLNVEYQMSAVAFIRAPISVRTDTSFSEITFATLWRFSSCGPLCCHFFRTSYYFYYFRTSGKLLFC